MNNESDARTSAQGHEYRQETHVEPGGKAFVVQHGNMVIYQWRPEYRIERYEFKAPASNPRAPRAQPSRMLRAQYQIVPFDAARRHKEIEQLTGWRDRGDEKSAILLHGPGGQGKTRLANYAAEAALAADWHVLSAVSNRAGIPGEELARSELSTSGKAGVMVIVDYAERWPVSALLSLMQDPVLQSGHIPLRILLIARPGGTWWQAVSSKVNNDLQIPTSRIRLPSLAADREDWPFIVEAASAAFIDAYAPPEPITVEIPETAAHADYPIVLAAHMAALALVDAAVRGEPAPSGSTAITEYLLGRERAYWMDLHEADPVRFPTNPVVMSRTVFTATLTRPLAYEEAVAALHCTKTVEARQPTAPVLADHAICYPPSDPATVLEPLYPDRLGEDFLALSIPALRIPVEGGQASIDMSDPWAAGALTRLLHANSDQAPAWLPSTVSVLVETAARWPHVAEEQLFPIIRENPRLMLLAGGSVLETFTELPTVPMNILEDIECLLPAGRGSDLAIGRAAVAEKLAEFRLTQTDDPAQQAAIYTSLRSALSHAGLSKKEALAAAEEVRLYRVLARAHSEEYMIPLAIALDAYGTALVMTGDIGSSIQAHVESVNIYHMLYSVRPDLFGDELARTLTNLGNTLLRVHLLDEALQAQQEAVRIRRSADPARGVLADDLGLAGSLVQLSATLQASGRLPEARDMVGEAVEIIRNVIRSGDYEVDQGFFAHALEIKARILVLMDRHNDAISLLEEVIGILRPLANLNPAVHGGLLSQALSHLGICLLSEERRRAGIEALQEAVEIFSSLPERSGIAGIEPNFVGMQCNLGMALTQDGRADVALPVLADAVEQARILVSADPYHAWFLPWALHNSAVALMALDRWEAALLMSGEAEQLFRELASAEPENYTERWHKTRDALAYILEVLGRREEASAVRSRKLLDLAAVPKRPSSVYSLLYHGGGLELLMGL